MRSRRDLVLAMSVGEIFLLLLFVVWVSSKVTEGPLDRDGLKNRVTELENQVQLLTEEVLDLRVWKKEYEAFLVSLGHKIPATLADLREKIRATGSGRGPGPCVAVKNRLLVITVSGGIRTLSFLKDFHNHKAGEVVDGDALATVIDEINRYQLNKSCRFNYRFDYATYEDYHDGREYFDRFFLLDGSRDLRTAK